MQSEGVYVIPPPNMEEQEGTLKITFLLGKFAKV